MKTLIKSLIVAIFALTTFTQSANAYEGHWDHHDHRWHDRHWFAEHPHIIYYPARVYYYPAPATVVYPQPFYAAPVSSLQFIIR